METPSAPSYREIALTQGQVALVDEFNFEWINQWKWQARWNSKSRTFYAQREFRNDDGKQDSIQMHRQILGLTKGDGKTGEHKNHNGIDNRKDNLRVATNSENMFNRRTNRNSSTGLKGVTKHGAGWRAQIQANKKHIVIGYFRTPEAAHKAYCEKSKELHGDFHCPS